MAMTNWPLRSCAASPKRMAGKLAGWRGIRCGTRPFAAASSLGSMASTARPLRGSAARIVAGYVLPSIVVIVCVVAFADGQVLRQHEAGLVDDHAGARRPAARLRRRLPAAARERRRQLTASVELRRLLRRRARNGDDARLGAGDGVDERLLQCGDGGQAIGVRRCRLAAQAGKRPERGRGEHGDDGNASVQRCSPVGAASRAAHHRG